MYRKGTTSKPSINLVILKKEFSIIVGSGSVFKEVNTFNLLFLSLTKVLKFAVSLLLYIGLRFVMVVIKFGFSKCSSLFGNALRYIGELSERYVSPKLLLQTGKIQLNPLLAVKATEALYIPIETKPAESLNLYYYVVLKQNQMDYLNHYKGLKILNHYRAPRNI